MVSLGISLVLSVMLEHATMKSSAMYCIVQVPVARQGTGSCALMMYILDT